MADLLFVLLVLVVGFVAARIAMFVIFDRLSRLRERRRKG